MVGFAAPSLADVGSAGTDTTVSSATSGTTDAGSTDSTDSTGGGAADRATQPQDAKVAALTVGPNAGDQPGTANGQGGDTAEGDDPGNPVDDCVSGDVESCPKGLYCSVFAQVSPEYCGVEEPPTCDEDPNQEGCPVTCDDGEILVGGICVPEPTGECTPPDADPSDPDCDLPSNPTDPTPPGGGGTPPPSTGTPGGGTPPTTSTPPSNGGGKGHKGPKGGKGPSTSAGGTSSSNGSGSEGTVPGGEIRGESHGTSACGDPAICNDSGILGVDASTGANTEDTTTVAGTGSTLPQTGAPASTQALLVLGIGLLLAGGALIRPRKPALHRA